MSLAPSSTPSTSLLDQLQRFQICMENILPANARWLARFSREQGQFLRYRQDILQPLFEGHSQGVHLTVSIDGGIGYAASSDLSPEGMYQTARAALQWARYSQGKLLFDVEAWQLPSQQSHQGHPPTHDWRALSLSERLDIVGNACHQLKTDRRIVDWSATVGQRNTESLLLSSRGAELYRQQHFLTPGLSATANVGTRTERRSGGGINSGRQGGIEQLTQLGFADDAPRIAEQALQLLNAPECPVGKRDLLLMPSQMVLQIHESIGHPLELDRILGDERNYAGSSFVREDMFGNYQYGSHLLNVSFDPEHPEQLASYHWDDEGNPAEKALLIRNGQLERPLGSPLSASRAHQPTKPQTDIHAVANARASSWNRPSIDRMANLNIEPGETPLAEMIAKTKHGILMDTNRSWSIDDHRNKFQFGCEYGQLIENGELTQVVRNPNYRGISAKFWRNLKAVGNSDGFEIHGVTNCGKGEPNQAVYVGHASPPCLFSEIDVFGGEL